LNIADGFKFRVSPSPHGRRKSIARIADFQQQSFDAGQVDSEFFAASPAFITPLLPEKFPSPRTLNSILAASFVISPSTPTLAENVCTAFFQVDV